MHEPSEKAGAISDGRHRQDKDKIIVGLLKHIDMDSVELQHVARDIWVKKVVSD